MTIMVIWHMVQIEICDSFLILLIETVLPCYSSVKLGSVLVGLGEILMIKSSIVILSAFIKL